MSAVSCAVKGAPGRMSERLVTRAVVVLRLRRMYGLRLDRLEGTPGSGAEHGRRVTVRQ
jgi:hypothetical protein